jgi:hypothetical protein
MQTRGYLPLSEDAQCAWEAGGREATTFGTGDNGPVCLLMGLLQLRRTRAADVLRDHTNLTPDALRQVLKGWAGEDEKLLNLAIVRNRAEDLAHRAGRRAITPEDLLLALADEDVVDTRLYRVMTRADPRLDLRTIREALAGS